MEFQCPYWASFPGIAISVQTGTEALDPTLRHQTHYSLYYQPTKLSTKKTLTAAARERNGVRELLLLLPQLLLLLLCCFRCRAAQKLRHSSTSHYCVCYYYCYCYCLFRSWFEQHPVELLRRLVTPAPVCSSGGNRRTLCSHFTCQGKKIRSAA